MSAGDKTMTRIRLLSLGILAIILIGIKLAIRMENLAATLIMSSNMNPPVSNTAFVWIEINMSKAVKKVLKYIAHLTMDSNTALMVTTPTKTALQASLSILAVTKTASFHAMKIYRFIWMN